MGLYEIQVLDSYENKTYADGQASAVYGQYPPLVNASRPPAQWQTYDIIFHGPRFNGGKLRRPARITVLHNGVLVQDNVELTGPTAHGERPPYKLEPEKAAAACRITAIPCATATFGFENCGKQTDGGVFFTFPFQFKSNWQARGPLHRERLNPETTEDTERVFLCVLCG